MVALDILKALVTLPLLFLLPGLALFKSRLFGEYRLHWVARLLFIIAVSASTASLAALFLAEAGYLRLWLLDIVLASAALAVRLALGNTGRRVFQGARRGEVLAVAALVVIGAALFFQPFEVVMGDGDPGYNFNIGYHLARTGEMSIHDPSIPGMSEQELRTFYEKDVVQFLPFHLRVRESGKIQPLLYHMLPVWMGVFISLFGTWGGMYVAPLLMLLSVMTVYALVRRHTGAPGAAAAALAMELCFLVMYFARLPVSEAGCMFFMLASLLFFAEYSSTKGPATGLASALAATTAFLFRPEALLLAFPMLAVEVVEVFRGRFDRGDLVFSNALLAGLLYTWFYMKFVGYFYLVGNMRKVFSLFGARNGVNTALYLFLGCVLVAVVFFNVPELVRLCERAGEAVARASGRFRAGSGRAASALVALAVLAVFVFLYFVLPAGGARVESSRRFFFYAAGYFGGVAVFVFVAGLCWYLYGSRNTAFTFVLGFAVAGFAALFAESTVTSGYQPWLTRRFMTLVAPALFVGLGYLLGRFWESGRAYLRAAAGLTLALLLAFFVFLDVPLFGFVQYKGVDRQIAGLAAKADGDLVIFTDTFKGEALGVPLRYQHGVDARRAYTLDGSVDLLRTVKEYNARGRKVLIETQGLATLDPEGDLLDRLSFVRAFDQKISFDRMSQSYKVIPRGSGREEHDMTFYYLVPRT